MKTFKIIALIALLGILFESIGGFIDGWNEPDQLAPIRIERTHPAFDKVTAVTFDVLPQSAQQVANLQTGTRVPAGFIQCHAYITPSGLTTFAYVLLAITGLFTLYGFYSLIRLFISVIRKEIFTPTNIRRIRWGVYTPTAYTLAKYFQSWCESHDAMTQLTVPGYVIQPASPFEFSWMSLILLILLTEVFVVAVRLKQENDLTI